MAKKKSAAKFDAPINFKTTAELKASLEDLAHLSRCTLSDILNRICAGVVAANKARITKFRQQAGQKIKMPPFATPTVKTAADEGDDNREENA